MSLRLLNYVARSESSRSASPIELKADGPLLGYLEDKSSRFYHKPDWKRNMSGWRRRRGLYTIESTTEYP